MTGESREIFNNRAAYVGYLGVSLFCLFAILNKHSYLDMAVATQQHAVDLAPSDSADKAAYLSNLGDSLHSRFIMHLGTSTDADRAVVVHQQAVDLTPGHHPDKPRYLSKLGTSFLTRYKRSSERSDREAAIKSQECATCLSPDGHPDKPRYLNRLGISLLVRFEDMGQLIDINAAIAAQEMAVRLTHDDNTNKARYLNALGISFLTRFEHLGELSDVEGAVRAQRAAVDLTADDHPNKATYFSALGNSLSAQAEGQGELADVDAAIIAQQEALNLSRDNASHLNNLGTSLLTRYKRLGELLDWQHALAVQQRAIDLTPSDHPDQAVYLSNLGNSFNIRVKDQSNEGWSAEAIGAYSRSAGSAFGPPSIRLKAACNWAALCSSFQPGETICAYSALIDLLPRVLWLSKTLEQRYKDIAGIGDAVTDAAAAAIRLGEIHLALEWLEQGRSIVWGQMLQLRTPLDTLRQHHPNDADELEKISRTLESTGSHSGRDHLSPSTTDTSQSSKRAKEAHRRLVDEYDRILERVRTFHDFSDFLKPKKSAYLCGVATSGSGCRECQQGVLRCVSSTAALIASFAHPGLGAFNFSIA